MEIQNRDQQETKLGMNRIIVIVVDDVESCRDTLRHLLSSMGLVAVSAESASAALACLAEVDLTDRVVLVTDINMPGTSGFDLSFEVKKRRPDSRTIFVSGDALELARVANFASPYDVFLEKPYTLESLNTALERALNFPNSSSSETMTWVSPIKSRSGID